MSDEKFITLVGHEPVLQHWPFLLEGLDNLNGTVKDRTVAKECFLRVHLDVACGKMNGRVIVMTSKNDKPLGFVTAYETTSDYRPERVLWVYAIYSNDKKPGAAKLLFGYLESWAKTEGFQEIQSQSGRTSGASIRWCRAQFGLSLSKLVFSKTI